MSAFLLLMSGFFMLASVYDEKQKHPFELWTHVCFAVMALIGAVVLTGVFLPIWS